MATSWFYILGWFPSVLAILGNTMVVLVILSRTRLHILPNWFVLSLAVADFAVGVTCFPTIFLCRKLVLCESNWGYDIAVLAIYSSVTNLCAMTVDRYIAIIKPLRYVTWMTSRRAASLMALSWSIPIALDFIPTICARLGKCKMQNRTLIFSKMFLLEILPCLFLLIATIQIIITARRHRWQTARLHAQLRFNQVSHRQPRYFSSARVIIIVLVVFLTCYCVELYSVIRFLVNSSKPTQEVINAILLLAVVNSSANPIAYALFKRDIRRELKILCRPCASRPARYDLNNAVQSHLVNQSRDSRGIRQNKAASAGTNKGPATVHTTPEEFENGGFALKTHQMFFVHTTTDELQKSTVIGHFGFVSQQDPIGEIT